MSLQTDRVFYDALKSDATIVRMTSGRLYNTSIPLPDSELDNVPCPYIIVTFDGFNNLDFNKDYDYEGMTDSVKIGVEITAITRETLAVLSERVRQTIRTYFETNDGDLIPLDYTLSSGPVTYDADKPCFALQLSYQCTTNI